jgi:hypothetical protein
MQFQVACGRIFCKAGCQIKMPVSLRLAGAGMGRVGTSANGQLWTVCGDHSVGVALQANSDDLAAKKICFGQSSISFFPGVLRDAMQSLNGMRQHRLFSFRNADSTWSVLVAFGLLAYLISPCSSAFGCEFPSALLGSIGGPNKQVQEFRIPLGPPDYRDGSATKRHLIFATVLARLFTAEVQGGSRGRCSIIASTSLFPDLRVTSVNGEISESICGAALRFNFQPKEELVSKIALSIASARRASPAGYMTEAGNILRETLRRVYDAASPMHALVSVEPSDLESMSATSFVEWFEGERANERTVLTPVTYCESDEEKLNARPSNGEMPYSHIIQPQTVSVEMHDDQLLKSGGLSYAVLVGADSRPQNSPLRSAATEKYCDREKSFSTGPGDQFVARTDCLVEIVHNTDTWALIFCDPKTCLSENRAKTVALAIRDDPEVVLLGNASAVNDQSRGPYLVKLTRMDK